MSNFQPVTHLFCIKPLWTADIMWQCAISVENSNAVFNMINKLQVTWCVLRQS
jgi:hypothetical protein